MLGSWLAEAIMDGNFGIWTFCPGMARQVHLWTTEQAELKQTDTRIVDMCFSPDSTRLAVGMAGYEMC